MSIDPEVQTWQKVWKAESPQTPADSVTLRTETAKQARRLRTKFISELSAAASFLIGSLAYAATDRTSELILWAACVWITTILATAFTIWNWKSLWKGSTHSVSDYVVFYRDQARATLRASKFGLAFLVVQVAISTTWFTVEFVQGRILFARYALGLGLILLLTVTFLILILTARTRAQRELARISIEEGVMNPA
jgi:hypothetical protein